VYKHTCSEEGTYTRVGFTRQEDAFESTDNKEGAYARARCMHTLRMERMLTRNDGVFNDKEDLCMDKFMCTNVEGGR
jgi:hypothetical protein